jgi:hypothetical protein
MSYRNILGTLDKDLILNITSPTDGVTDNVTGILQLGAVDGASEGNFFAAGTVCGDGALRVVAQDPADRAKLAAAADAASIVVVVDYIGGSSGSTVVGSASVSHTAAAGSGLPFYTDPIVLDGRDYGRVKVTVTLPASIGLGEISIAWVPTSGY